MNEDSSSRSRQRDECFQKSGLKTGKWKKILERLAEGDHAVLKFPGNITPVNRNCEEFSICASGSDTVIHPIVRQTYKTTPLSHISPDSQDFPSSRQSCSEKGHNKVDSRLSNSPLVSGVSTYCSIIPRLIIFPSFFTLFPISPLPQTCNDNPTTIWQSIQFSSHFRFGILSLNIGNAISYLWHLEDIECYANDYGTRLRNAYVGSQGELPQSLHNTHDLHWQFLWSDCRGANGQCQPSITCPDGEVMRPSCLFKKRGWRSGQSEFD